MKYILTAGRIYIKTQDKELYKKQGTFVLKINHGYVFSDHAKINRIFSLKIVYFEKNGQNKRWQLKE